MKPTRNNLIIVPADNREEVLATGLIYRLARQDIRYDELSLGKVVSVGSDVNDGSFSRELISEGNYVQYYTQDGYEIDDKGTLVMIINKASILHLIK